MSQLAISLILGLVTWFNTYTIPESPQPTPTVQNGQATTLLKQLHIKQRPHRVGRFDDYVKDLPRTTLRSALIDLEVIQQKRIKRTGMTNTVYCTVEDILGQR